MKRTTKLLLVILSLALAAAHASCGGRATSQPRRAAPSDAPNADAANSPAPAPTPEQYSGRMIHVIVALCDNVNQGIVPVPAALGDGDNPRTNLYWGARYGVKTFFARSRDWRLVSEVKNPKPFILERLVFKHAREDAYLVADAYRGAEIKRATVDLLDEAAGVSRETVSVGGRRLGVARGARSHLVAYVGHDGLMDFRLGHFPRKQDEAARDAV
ncbi:MAG TPA: hypothetical protein VEQ42_12880, partial [Pyrinomonadaceae bacterium]|nr:hypothetical protein [Pyrinomonadaceae bacterium]